MPTALKDLLGSALQENAYSYSEFQQQQFVHYLELLQKWNRVFNLTSIDAPQDMVYLHILDSLAIHPYLQGTRMLDVGSGGGLPGLPLAIFDPSKTWVLLDKSQKKTRFLLQAIAELELKNVFVASSRCEDFHSPSCFDTVVSRAFGSIKLFIDSTQHLICPQGLFLAMKGRYPDEELQDLPQGFAIVDTQKLDIHGLQAERHLVRIVNSIKNKESL